MLATRLSLRINAAALPLPITLPFIVLRGVNISGGIGELYSISYCPGTYGFGALGYAFLTGQVMRPLEKSISLQLV